MTLTTSPRLFRLALGVVAFGVLYALVANMGLIYLVAAVSLGAVFLWRAWVLWRQGTSPERSTSASSVSTTLGPSPRGRPSCISNNRSTSS